MGIETKMQDGDVVIAAEVHQGGDSVQLRGAAKGFDVEDAVIACFGVLKALCYAVQTVCAYGIFEVAPGFPEPLAVRGAEKEKGDAHLPTDGDAAVPEPAFQIMVRERFHDGIKVAYDADAKRGFGFGSRVSSLLTGLFIHAADVRHSNQCGSGHLNGV